MRRFQEACGVKEVKKSSSQEKLKLGSASPDGPVDWLISKTKVRRRLKSHSAGNSPGSSPEPPDVIECECIALVDVYFRIATELGYEPFYITFFPILFWNIDSYLARHAVLLWCFSMYIGQASKALVKWKRPDSPPAIRLEQNSNLETEYGFPSTHTIVSTTVPFYCLYSCFNRYEFPFALGLMIAVIWWMSVCISRLYLGVHTVLDILGGIAISLFVLAIAIPCTNLMDDFIFNSFMAAPTGILIVIVLLYIYPVEPQHWSMDRGDTAAILGSGLGVYLASVVQGPSPDDLAHGPFHFTVPTLAVFGLGVVRFIVGILLLLPTRFIMKLLCFRLLPAIMPTHGVEEVVKRPLVELPYKIITYGAIGFNALYLSHIVFQICGINRWDFIGQQ